MRFAVRDKLHFFDIATRDGKSHELSQINDTPMNWFVYHIASGHSFFTGVALLIVAALMDSPQRHIESRFVGLCILAGVIAIAISSTPIPYWLYGVAVVATIAWLASRNKNKWRRWAQVALIVSWACAVLVEVPYHFVTTLAPTSSRTITVIGDSVTAGMGSSDKSIRWPTLIAREHDIQVQDLSHPGETAASAIKWAESESIESSVVILEIGGNDLLGSTASDQFSRDLDDLLACVSAPARQVIMFELPLPPFRNEYGRIQRSLARKHQVVLVPKRVFLSILAGEGATVDTIHLTQVGHRRMADRVWRLLSSAFPATVEPKEINEESAATGKQGDDFVMKGGPHWGRRPVVLRALIGEKGRGRRRGIARRLAALVVHSSVVCKLACAVAT